MVNNLQILNKNVFLGNLKNYIHLINKFPFLSLDDEIKLAQLFQRESDLVSAQKLVVSHLRYVVKISKSYLGYGLIFSDLVQEGTIGLIKSVIRFNPNRGVRLVSFAIYWIRSEIQNYILKNWRIIKIATTKAQRKLFFKLRSFSDNLNWLNDDEINIVANDLGVSSREVIMMEERIKRFDLNIDLNFKNFDFLNNINYYNDPLIFLEKVDFNNYIYKKFNFAFKKLDLRSKDILKKRFLSSKKETLQDLSFLYGISSERIRQLENNAINKLKSLIKI